MFDALWCTAMALGVVTIGLARIAAWALDRREHSAQQKRIQAEMVAQASAEVRR